MSLKKGVERINSAHSGTFLSEESGDFRTVFCRILKGEFRHSLFSIYNNCAWGHRTSKSRPKQLFHQKRKIKTHPKYGLPLELDFPEPVELVPERLPDESLFTVKSAEGFPIFQVSVNCLYLLFDLNKHPHPDASLIQIYEQFVLPLDRSHLCNPMRLFVSDGENAYSQTFSQIIEKPILAKCPVTASENEINKALDYLSSEFYQAVSRQIPFLEEQLKKEKNDYRNLLKTVYEKKDKLLLLEHQVDSLKSIKQESSEDLRKIYKQLMENYYEWIVMDGNYFYGLTKGITIKGDFEVPAGKFLIKIKKENCDLEIEREDGKKVQSEKSPNWIKAPHITENRICWGNQREKVRDYERERNFLQLFIQAYLVIEYYNKEDCYCTLEDYANLLGIPFQIPEKAISLSIEADWE